MTRGLAAALLWVALAVPAHAQTLTETGIAGEAAAALADNPVFVHPDAEPSISGADAERLRGYIAERRAGPMYIAILPAEARNEAGGDATEVLRAIARELRRNGVYAGAVGGQFRAGSAGVDVEARRLATEAFEAKSGEGLSATLFDFVDRVGTAKAGGDTASGNGGEDGGIPGSVLLLGMAGIGGGAWALSRRNRRRRDAAELEEVKDAARDDLVTLGEEIRALELDIDMGANEAAKAHYAEAIEAYRQAEEAFDRSRRPEELAEVSEHLERGRWAMIAARARIEGREPPERRAPCFFDPRHGPSTREVEWAPEGGQPRPVPACEADALRVEAGHDPQSREVMVGGRATPYWAAPGAFSPWAGGYFGGFGGFLPGLFLGSLMSGAFFPHDVHADPGGAGGDFGGGGGDFGGFGGGDFGGGDFGGGGDF